MAIPEERFADKAAERPAVFAPLYRQIRQLIVSALDQGEWKPGELIPSEMDLAARFQVSQGTVRKAIDELAAENLLVRRQGKGTFVATHHEARAQYRFLRLQRDSGPEVPAQSRFLECRRIRASAEIAALQRQALAAGVSVAVDFEYRAVPAFQQLAQLLQQGAVGQVRLIIEHRVGCQPENGV